MPRLALSDKTELATERPGHRGRGGGMDVLSRNAGRRSLLVGFAAGGVLACAIAAGAWILTDGAAPKSAKPELTFRLQVEAAQLGANRFWLDANLLADNRSDELPEKLLAISWWV